MEEKNERILLQPSTLLAPAPAALVSVRCGEEENLLTVAWCGIVNSHPPMTYISVRPERHSYPMLKESREFVLHLTTAALCRAVDYCGIYTGAKVNKFEKCGLHPIPSRAVAAPTLEEAPLALECRVREILPLGSHDMFLSDIVSVTARPELFDERGRLCLERAGLCAYAHGEYYALGKFLGKFGFSAARRGKKGEKKK